MRHPTHGFCRTRSYKNAGTMESFQDPSYRHWHRDCGFDIILSIIHPRTLIHPSSFHHASIMDQSPTHQFAYPQSRDIHIIALVPSTLTLLASVLATYWFFSMQRNFRITLVLILVLSDASKSLWIFVFNAVGLAGIPIRTHSAFCQVGGFFLQMSFEACGEWFQLNSAADRQILRFSFLRRTSHCKFLHHDGFRTREMGSILFVDGWWCVVSPCQ